MGSDPRRGPLFAGERAFVGGVVLAGTALCLLVAIKVPFSMPTPVFYENALEWLRTGSIPDRIYPVGYTAWIAAMWALGGQKLLVASQVALHAATLVLAFAALREVDVPRRVAAVAVGLLALHPYLLVDANRVIDHNLTVPLLLAFVWLLAHARRRERPEGPGALVGLVLGALVLVRPNLVLLALLWLGVAGGEVARGRWPWSRVAASALAGAALALTLALCVSWPLKGRLWLFPSSGALTFFCGNNEYSREYLLRNYNTEQSHFPAVQLHGIDAGAPDLDQRYWRAGTSWIRKHPIDWAELTALKAVVFFLPDGRRASAADAPAGRLTFLLQLLMALPAPLCLLARLWRRQWAPLAGLAVPALVALYLAPFVLISSDPRYRLPLDVLLVLDAAWVWSRRSDAGAASATLSSPS